MRILLHMRPVRAVLTVYKQALSEHLYTWHARVAMMLCA